MNDLLTYHLPAGEWTRRGTPGGDGFVLGSTMPTQANTGVLAGVTRTAYGGSLTITTGNQTFENLNFPGLMVLEAANLTFINCHFTGSYSGTGGGGIVMCKHASCSNIRFERCTIKPTTPGDRYDGIYGHHYTAYRCQVEHTVDGFAVANQYAAPVNVHIEGCWVGNLSWYDDDRGAHVDGTHNDGVQQHSGTGLFIIGNSFYGYKYNVLGTPALDSSIDTRRPQIGQLTLSQHTTYFLVADVHVNNNWLWGSNWGVKFYSVVGASLGGGQSAWAAECLDNTWMDDGQLDKQIRTDDNVTLNGTVWPTNGSAGTADTNGNHYDTVSPDVAVGLRGTAIMVRCDDVPAP